MAEFNFSPIQKVRKALTEDTSVLSQFFRPETFRQTIEKTRQLPGIKQLSGFLQKLKPESEEEALKRGMVNLGSKDKPIYFDITGAVGSLRNVAGKSAQQLTKEVVSQADTALFKLINSIKSAKPARKELAKLQRIERGKRAGAVAGILERGEGEKGFFQALGKLKGELVPEAKKPTFEGLRATEQPISKDLQPLAQEVRKYKSAEEFVKAQKPVYHGTVSEFEQLGFGKGVRQSMLSDKQIESKAIFFSEAKKDAEFFAQNRLEYAIDKGLPHGKPKVIDAFIDLKNPADLTSPTKADAVLDKAGISIDREVFGIEPIGGGLGSSVVDEVKAGRLKLSELAMLFDKQRNIDALKAAGFDGAVLRESERFGLGKSFAVFDPSQIKTKSQLTDFYNQTVRGGEQITEKLTQLDVDELFKKVQQNPILDIYEKINASTGLKNVFEGVIPQPHQLSLLEETFGSDLISEILKKRPNIEKFKDILTEVVNIPRSLMASFDMSAPLRQGIIFTLTKPGPAARATREMFEQVFSQKNFENWLLNLKTEPIYKLVKDSNLYIADPTRISAGLSAKEERFMTNMAQKIPVIGGLIKASERAYTSYLNKLRVDVFKNISNKFIKDGLDPKTDKEVFDSLADFINNATGRGDLGKLNRISQQLNTVFFSPRLIASRFNMLNPAWYVKQSPQVRKEAIKSMFEFIGVGSTLLTLAKAGGADVELDPRSTDFGKIRVGDTRWDIWGGFQQWIRVISQMASGARKTTTKKEVIPLSAKKFPFETRLDVAERFLKGKLAPVPRLITELMEGQKIFGDEITLEEEALNNSMPLYLQDIREAIEGIGPEALFTVGVPGFFGVGVQTYLEQQKKGTEFKF